jgi:ATP-dependent 26S proteasome regulatory subunit
MSNKKDIYKSMLNAVQVISEATREKTFNPELIQSLDNIAIPIIKFFSLSLEEAIILCYCIDANLKDQVVNKESIISHFGKDITALADLEEYIEQLNQKKLIFLSHKSKRFARQYKFIHLNPKVLAAMAEGDASLLGLRSCDTFSDFLMEVNELIVNRMNNHISSMELMIDTNQLLEKNKSIREVKWIKKQKRLKGQDLLVFLNICIEQSEGEDEVDIEKIISEVIDSSAERIKFKQAIKSEKSILFTNNYIEHAGNIFGMMNLVKLTDDTIEQLMHYKRSDVQREFNPRMGTLINCEKIGEEQLYYNHQEENQITTLKNALLDLNYKNITDRMRKSNMVPGLTILLFGPGGTGKTATVKALARETGRNLFMVDIPKVNSKWVGESEKNLSKVFEEYRKAKKYYDQHPILLFNEADAILSKRINVNSSVDKMNNTMQNILLQELEDFEGIFMATTNLANNLDASFDRRMLWKLELNKPDSQVRHKIIKSVFPEFENSFIEDLNQKFQLTGGQISNIKKKLLVKSLLHEIFNIKEEVIALCEQENTLRNHARPVIGFQTY